MKVSISILLFILGSTTLWAQSTYFLDSLFLIDVSNISKLKNKYQHADIQRLRNDWGLSVGTNITNSYQEEIDAGLSTRIFLKSNLFSNGWYSNAKDAEIILNEIVLDSLQGNEKALAYNYGIFYNYIIQQYNTLKIEKIDAIIHLSNVLSELQKEMYYKKRIDYKEIIAISTTIDQYRILRKTQKEYNETYQKIIDTLSLPKIPTSLHWDVDFKALLQTFENDSTLFQIQHFKNEILEIEALKKSTPNLSLAIGYDISRHRPFFGANFSYNLTFKNKQSKEAQHNILNNDVQIQKVQQTKELLNLQVEFLYKKKKIRELHAKIEVIEEEQRQFEIKSQMLSLGESKSELTNKLNMLLLGYEILDLRQQQMLLLLQIKKILNHIPIAPYLKLHTKKHRTIKFAGMRFIPVNDPKKISVADLFFLKQNEVVPVPHDKILDLDNIFPIDPSTFKTRSEMEKFITQQLNVNAEYNFIFLDLELLQDLELRTINDTATLTSFSN